MGPTTRWARGVLPVFAKVGMTQLLVRVLEAQQWWYDKVLRRWLIGCQFRPVETDLGSALSRALHLACNERQLGKAPM